MVGLVATQEQEIEHLLATAKPWDARELNEIRPEIRLIIQELLVAYKQTEAMDFSDPKTTHWGGMPVDDIVDREPVVSQKKTLYLQDRSIEAVMAARDHYGADVKSKCLNRIQNTISEYLALGQEDTLSNQTHLLLQQSDNACQQQAKKVKARLKKIAHSHADRLPDFLNKRVKLLRGEAKSAIDKQQATVSKTHKTWSKQYTTELKERELKTSTETIEKAINKAASDWSPKVKIEIRLLEREIQRLNQLRSQRGSWLGNKFRAIFSNVNLPVLKSLQQFFRRHGLATHATRKEYDTLISQKREELTSLQKADALFSKVESIKPDAGAYQQALRLATLSEGLQQLEPLVRNESSHNRALEIDDEGRIKPPSQYSRFDTEDPIPGPKELGAVRTVLRTINLEIINQKTDPFPENKIQFEPDKVTTSIHKGLYKSGKTSQPAMTHESDNQLSHLATLRNGDAPPWSLEDLCVVTFNMDKAEEPVVRVEISLPIRQGLQKLAVMYQETHAMDFSNIKHWGNISIKSIPGYPDREAVKQSCLQSIESQFFHLRTIAEQEAIATPNQLVSQTKEDSDAYYQKMTAKIEAAQQELGDPYLLITKGMRLVLNPVLKQKATEALKDQLAVNQYREEQRQQLVTSQDKFVKGITSWVDTIGETVQTLNQSQRELDREIGERKLAANIAPGQSEEDYLQSIEELLVTESDDEFALTLADAKEHYQAVQELTERSKAAQALASAMALTMSQIDIINSYQESASVIDAGKVRLEKLNGQLVDSQEQLGKQQAEFDALSPDKQDLIVLYDKRKRLLAQKMELRKAKSIKTNHGAFKTVNTQLKGVDADIKGLESHLRNLRALEDEVRQTNSKIEETIREIEAAEHQVGSSGFQQVVTAESVTNGLINIASRARLSTTRHPDTRPELSVAQDSLLQYFDPEKDAKLSENDDTGRLTCHQLGEHAKIISHYKNSKTLSLKPELEADIIYKRELLVQSRLTLADWQFIKPEINSEKHKLDIHKDGITEEDWEAIKSHYRDPPETLITDGMSEVEIEAKRNQLITQFQSLKHQRSNQFIHKLHEAKRHVDKDSGEISDPIQHSLTTGEGFRLSTSEFIDFVYSEGQALKRSDEQVQSTSAVIDIQQTRHAFIEGLKKGNTALVEDILEEEKLAEALEEAVVKYEDEHTDEYRDTVLEALEREEAPHKKALQTMQKEIKHLQDKEEKARVKFERAEKQLEKANVALKTEEEKPEREQSQKAIARAKRAQQNIQKRVARAKAELIERQAPLFDKQSEYLQLMEDTLQVSLSPGSSPTNPRSEALNTARKLRNTMLDEKGPNSSSKLTKRQKHLATMKGTIGGAKEQTQPAANDSAGPDIDTPKPDSERGGQEMGRK